MNPWKSIKKSFFKMTVMSEWNIIESGILRQVAAPDISLEAAAASWSNFSGADPKVAEDHVLMCRVILRLAEHLVGHHTKREGRGIL